MKFLARDGTRLSDLKFAVFGKFLNETFNICIFKTNFILKRTKLDLLRILCRICFENYAVYSTHDVKE